MYGLVGTDVLLKHAEEMAAHGVKRFGIVTSGTTVSDRDLDSLCESARILRDRVDIALCGSLGILTKEKLRRLKEAGFTSIHHNLETARSHFASICTTHDYDQDIATLKDARDAGFRVCSCGIFGLGETWEQRVELLETEKECGVESRAVILGHVQRGGSPTVRDRVVASQMGYKAVQLLMQGIGNRVIVLKDDHIIDYDIYEALNMQKKVDNELYKIAHEISI